MTSEAAIGKAAHAALGLACTIAARLPWSRESQHDAYLLGLRDGLADGYARGVLAGRQAQEAQR